jgi:signal transduction histidine kinase
MSHELRTPLNGIIGFSEFLIDEKPGPLNAKQKDFLGDILSSGRHLLELIGDVLDLAKIETGRMDVQTEAFSPGEAVEKVCTVIAPLGRKKNVTIRREIAVGPGAVVLDRHLFIQVLYNLLSNAVRFSEPGGTVRVFVDAPTAGALTLRVRDAGAGLAPAELERLFDGIQHLGPNSGARVESHLGLNLTRQIVELQGGRIAAESEPGFGTMISVHLPLQPPTSQGARA